MSGSCSAAPAPVPPQRALDPCGELAAGRRGQIHRQRIRAAEVVPHDRVLPGGDPAGVQVLLGSQQARPAARRWSAPARRPPTRFAAPSCRVPCGLPSERPLDPAVGRVGGPRVDPRELQRPGIGPGAVPVAIRQVGRPAAGDLIQRLPVRRAAGEPLHPPARAGDPAPAPGAGGRRRRSWPARRPGWRPRSGCSRSSSRPAKAGCTCASWKPGSSARPRRSTTSVAGPIRSWIRSVASLADRRDPAADDCDRAGGTAVGAAAATIRRPLASAV